MTISGSFTFFLSFLFYSALFDLEERKPSDRQVKLSVASWFSGTDVTDVEEQMEKKKTENVDQMSLLESDHG